MKNENGAKRKKSGKRFATRALAGVLAIFVMMSGFSLTVFAEGEGNDTSSVVSEGTPAASEGTEGTAGAEESGTSDVSDSSAPSSDPSTPANSGESKVTHTVTFYDADGGVFLERQVEEGAALTSPDTTPEAPEGTRFTGWFEENAETNYVFEGSSVTGALSLYARFEAASDAGDGEEDDSEEDDGEEDPAITGDEEEGQNGILGFGPFAMATVTYLNSDNSVMQEDEVGMGSQINGPSEDTENNIGIPDGFTRLDYWYVQGDTTETKVTFPYTVNADVVFVPKFASTYVVVFNSGGGTDVEPVVVEKNATVTQPAVSRTGYTFVGWFDENDVQVSFPLTVTSNMMLTAKWTGSNVNYTVAIWMEKPGYAADFTPDYTDQTQYNYVTLFSLSGTAGATTDLTLANLASKNPTVNTYFNGTYSGADASLKILRYATPQYVESKTILGNGQTVINLYASRTVYTYNFNLNGSGRSMVVNGTTYTNGGTYYSFNVKYEMGLLGLFPFQGVDYATFSGFEIGSWQPPSGSGATSTTGMKTANGIASKRLFVDDNLLSPNGQVKSYTLTASAASGSATVYRYWVRTYTGEDTTGKTTLTYTDGYTYVLMDEYNQDYKGSLSAKTINGLTSVNNNPATYYYQDGTYYTSSGTGRTSHSCFFYYRTNQTLSFNLRAANSEISNYSAAAYGNKTLVYGQPVLSSKPVDPIRPGYTFSGWFLDADYKEAFDWNTQTVPQGGITAYARWDSTAYTVTFLDKKGGAVQWSQGVASGAYAQERSEYWQEGTTYANGEFLGWYYDVAGVSIKWSWDMPVTKDYTLYAKWPTIKVSFLGGTNGTLSGAANISYTVTYGTEWGDVRVPIPMPNEGYSFDKWDSAFPSDSTQITGSLTYTALWKINSYSIRYVDGKPSGAPGSVTGMPTTPQTYNYNAGVTVANTPVLPGYTFMGWQASGKLTTLYSAGAALTMPAGDVTFTATWSVNSHNVSYVANKPATAAGSVTGMPTTPQTYSYYAEVTAATAPSLAGYDFAGWAATGAPASSYGAGDKFNMPNNAVTLTAQWTVRSDTAYKVEHYQQDILTNGYVLVSADTVNLSGTTGGVATATPKSYTGFTQMPLQTTYQSTGNAASATVLPIANDGSLVVKLYYNRELYSVTYTPGSQGDFTNDVHSNVRYGAATPEYSGPKDGVNPKGKPGYTFTGWLPTWVGTVTGTVSYEAQWSANANTAYKVEYYQQNLAQNGYDLVSADTDNRTGETATLGAYSIKSYTGFDHVNTTFEANGVTALDATIAGNGSLIIRLYYNRQVYGVHYEANVPAEAYGTVTVPVDASYAYGATVSVANPSLAGYTFGGWEASGGLTGNQAGGSTFSMPVGDVTLTAVWTVKSDTVYRVEHYKQNVDGSYPGTASDIDNHSGTTNAVGAYSDKTYTGFSYNSGLTTFTTSTGTIADATIASDGSLVVKLYYERQSYELSYDMNQPAGSVGIVGNVPATPQSYKYNQGVVAAGVPTLSGYTFTGWAASGAMSGSQGANSTFNMPAGNVKLTAQWQANTATTYKVEHYQQNMDGSTYPGTATLTESKTGTTDALVTVSALVKSYTGFTYDSSATSFTTSQGVITDAKIAGDGSLIIRLYYTRHSNTVHYEANTPAEAYTSVQGVPADASYAFDDVVNVATPSLEGYTFGGWIASGALSGNKAGGSTFNMPAGDVTLTAVWTANSSGTEYTVEHYQQNIADNDYTLVGADTQLLAGATNGAPTHSNKSYTGFTFVAAKTTYEATGIPASTAAINIASDGSLVIKLYYDRNSYNVSYVANQPAGSIGSVGNMPTTPQSYKFADTVTAAAEPTLAGYEFKGWTASGAQSGVYQKDDTFSMPAGAVTLTAIWAAEGATKYTVMYLQQNILDNNYTAVDADTLTAYNITDTSVTPPVNSYTGFTHLKTTYTTSSNAESTTPRNIAGDGSLVIKVYYDRETYTVQYLKGDQGTFTNETYSSVKYGAVTPAFAGSTTGNPGYDFDGWTPSVASTVTGNVDYVAQWKVKDGIEYTVEHYQQQLNGTYPAAATFTETKYGKTTAAAVVTPRSDYGFTHVPASTTYQNSSTSASSTVLTIAGDGSLVVKHYYTRDTYTVNYDQGTFGTSGDESHASQMYGAATPLYKGTGIPTGRPGYTFTGWTPGVEATVTADATYVAGWSANTTTPYIVEYWQQDINAITYTRVDADTRNLSGTTDTTASVPSKSYTGFTQGDTTYAATGTPASTTVLDIAGDGSLIIRVYYERQSYGVSYVANKPAAAAGSVSGMPSGGTYDFDAVVTVGGDPYLEGYVFDGWVASGALSGTYRTSGTATFNMPAGAVTLTAKWLLNPRYVTYDAGAQSGAGNMPSPLVTGYEYNASVSVSTKVPTSSGWRFTGWLSSDGGMVYPVGTPASFTMPDYNVTLTAQWVKTFVVTIDPNNGAATSTQTIDTGALASDPGTPASPNGATFDGWHVGTTGGAAWDFGTDTVTGDMTLIARWTHTVAFDLNSGSAGLGGDYSTQTVERGTAATQPVDPERTGYTFKGWSTTGSASNIWSFSGPVNGNITLIAVWSINSYNVIYADGAPATAIKPVGGMPSSPQPYNYNQTVKAATKPTLEGHTFDGWQASGADSGLYAAGNTFAMPAGDVTLTGTWTINQYSVTYVANKPAAAAGSVTGMPTDATENYNTQITVGADPYLQGYVFGGWTASGALSGTYSTGNTFNLPAGNVTLTARWLLNPHTVTYVSGAPSTVIKPVTGMPATNPQLYEYDATVKASSALSAEGHTFTGWSLDGGTTLAYGAGDTFKMPDNDITLTGMWTINSYDVSYVANKPAAAPGTVTAMPASPQSYDYNQAASVDSSVPQLEGYTFKGWTASGGISGTYQPNAPFTMPAKHVTLTAVWEINKHSVSYSAGAQPGATGMPVSPTTYAYRATVKVGTAPASAGFVFTGWLYDDGTITATYQPGQTFLMPDAPVSLTAQWEAQYTVQYVDMSYNPGDAGYIVSSTVMGPAPVGTLVSETFTLPGGPYRDYEGVPSKSVTLTNTAADNVITFQVIKQITVTWEPNGGDWAGNTMPITAMYDRGTPIPAEASPARQYYNFQNWEVNGSAVSFPYTLDVDVSFVAKWKGDPTNYEIHYYIGTTSNKIAASVYASGFVGESLTAVAPRIVGWEPDLASQTIVLEPNALSQNVIEFRYVTHYYKVDFVDYNGVKLAATQQIAYGGSAIAPPDPYHADRIFTGWDTDYTHIARDIVVTAMYNGGTTSSGTNPGPGPGPGPGGVTPEPGEPGDDGEPGGPTEGETDETEIVNSQSVPNQEENIDLPNTPESFIDLTSGSWSLLSLILSIVGLFMTLLLLFRSIFSKNKKSEDDQGEYGEEYTETKSKTRFTPLRIISMILGLIPGLLFIFLDDFSRPMAFVNQFTIWVLIAFVAFAIMGILQIAYGRRTATDDEDQDINNTPANA